MLKVAMRNGFGDFGCDKCWPSDADAAWAACRSMPTSAEMVSESHFSVRLRICADCGQRFLTVFTETIDWSGGEDPQFWTVIPVTIYEANALSVAVDSIGSAIGTLPTDRRSLRHDFPRDGERRSFWSTGISIGMYD